MKKDFYEGARDSLPIALGYFSVSFTFGIMASGFGISPLISGLISLTNLTSAGQFAGISLIYAGSTALEMFLTTFVINLRYALMSITLTQNLSKDSGVLKRMAMSFFITDEIFAVAATRKTPVNLPYMLGIGLCSMAGWVGGTMTGALAGNLLSPALLSALGVALYAMFVAIVMPGVRKEIGCAFVCIGAVLFSCLIAYLPLFSFISSGFSIIICTVAAALLGAFLFPVKEGV